MTLDDEDMEHLRELKEWRAGGGWCARNGSVFAGAPVAAIDALIARHLPTRLEPTEEAIEKYKQAAADRWVCATPEVGLRRLHAAGLLKDEHMREVTE